MIIHNDCVLDIMEGDCRQSLKTLINNGMKVQTCVTSPPYFGLRDYGHKEQLGLEETHLQYIDNMVEVFTLIYQLLKDDGTLWLNIGDSYAGSNKGRMGDGSHCGGNKQSTNQGSIDGSLKINSTPNLKSKDLIGIPWMLAFALRDTGWYLRQDIIWAKPNAMPESVRDRCTKSHEYIFLFSKLPQYYFDANAIKTGITQSTFERYNRNENEKLHAYREYAVKQRGSLTTQTGFQDKWDNMTKQEQQAQGANKRSVWTIANSGFKGAHFATFPPELITPCILAGSKPSDVILDPFGGSGTTGAVALKYQRNAVICELNPTYVSLIPKRVSDILNSRTRDISAQ